MWVLHMFYFHNNTSNLKTMFAVLWFAIRGFIVNIMMKLNEIELHIHRAIMVIGPEYRVLSMTMLV